MPTQPSKFKICPECNQKRRSHYFKQQHRGKCIYCYRESERLRHQLRRNAQRTSKMINEESIEIVNMNHIKQPSIPHEELCCGCPIYADRTSSWAYKLCAWWGQCEEYGKIKEIINE